MRSRLSAISSGFVLIICAALAGMALTVWSTRLGPGVGGDATIYLTSAQNLVKGIGLGLVQADGSFRLLPYSAPLFPLILAPFSAAGFDLTSVARWLNVQLFGVLIFLVGFVSLRVSKDKWIGAAPAWLAAVSPILLPVYSWAMAEPLTLALGFGGLVMVVWNLNKVEQKGDAWFMFAGLLLGLSFATRYSAVAFLAAGVLMCLFWLDTPVKKRFLTAFQMGLVGIIPMFVWVIVQLGQTASVSSRSILTVAEMGGRFTVFWPQLNAALLVWLMPVSFQESALYPLWINQVLPAVVILVLIGCSVGMFCKKDQTSVSRLVNGLWVFSGLYLLIILLVYLSTYPPITIDNRMLSPVHTSLIWIAGLLLLELFDRSPRKIIRFLISMIVIGMVGWYGVRTIRIVQQNAETGLGYNSMTWQESPLIATIRALDGTEKIITNEPMAVLYLTGRVAWPVVEIYSNKPVTGFTRYGDGLPGLDPAEEEFHKGGSLLVLFDSLISQLKPIYGDQADERAKSLIDNLHVVATSQDGVILEYPVSKSN